MFVLSTQITHQIFEERFINCGFSKHICEILKLNSFEHDFGLMKCPQFRESRQPVHSRVIDLYQRQQNLNSSRTRSGSLINISRILLGWDEEEEKLTLSKVFPKEAKEM